jgi:serine/threonine protein kinase
MTPERYRQIGDLYHAALEVDSGERAALLETACAGDAELRREVESLIASHDQGADFIASPALAVAAELIAARETDALLGQTIARYRVLSLIGAGGMGRVYLAEDPELGRRVALKLLPEYFTHDKNRVQRFHQEARAASALNHPNILTVHEVGQVDGTQFIATEYVEGRTLRARLTFGPLDLHEALDVAAQVAAALVAAHAAGIVHRDIKPENIMIRRDGIVKVLDFGLAKLAPTQSSRSGPDDSKRALVKTNPGVVMGTVGYMSPEQARGLSLDARTDIWSLGVVIYQMLTGSSPFSGATTSDTLVSILEREPRSLKSFSPEIPEELEWIVTKALTKDCDDRYQTSREVLTDLRRLKQRLSVAAELERSVVPQVSGGANAERATSADTTLIASTRPRSKRWLVWATLLVAMVVLATTIIWESRADWFNHAAQMPVVVLMDSPLPDRVYDPETRKNGGTNADDITDILRDLPIVIEKENTSPLWHREDQVLRERPSLIVIHRSCFADATVGLDPQSTGIQVADKKIESFLGYTSLGNPTTEFLIYTRRSVDQDAWVLDLEKRFPQLKGRVVPLIVPGGAEHATFRDPETKRMLRQQVKSILGLP